MAIVVACRCGQAFEADLYLAGKVVQCPACRSPLAVPSPEPELLPAASYIPRPRAAVSRESREATESITKILVAGGVLLVMVGVLSVGILCYLQGTNPVKWISDLREQGKREREARAAARAALAGEQSSSSPLDGPIPASGPATISGLPAGWKTFEHQDGKFSVIFPAGPESIDRDVESAAGVNSFFTLTVTQNEHVFEATREFRTFRIAQGEEPGVYDILLEKRKGEMGEGIIEGSNQAIVNDRLVCDAILRGKVEGTEFHKYIRLIAYDNSVFELSCRVPVGKERSADIGAFLGKYLLK